MIALPFALLISIFTAQNSNNNVNIKRSITASFHQTTRTSSVCKQSLKCRGIHAIFAKKLRAVWETFGYVIPTFRRGNNMLKTGNFRWCSDAKVHELEVIGPETRFVFGFTNKTRIKHHDVMSENRKVGPNRHEFLEALFKNFPFFV